LEWRELSVFGNDGTLQVVPCSTFERTAMSISARWFMLSTTKHSELYRFGLPRGIIPYIL
jgi:hypothetical protein